MKRQLRWIGMLTLLFAFFFVAPFPGGEIMDGFGGLTIKIFLGYCAIILIAQVYSALQALRDMLTDYSTRKKDVSKRHTLR